MNLKLIGYVDLQVIHKYLSLGLLFVYCIILVELGIVYFKSNCTSGLVRYLNN